MASIPRKTYPELTALTAPVQSTDVLTLYRAPGPLRRTTVSELLGAPVLSLTIGEGTTSATLSFVNPSLDMRTNVPASRGELRLIPNDTGGRDANAGGEITLIGNDTEGADALAGNQALGVLYIRRIAGENESLFIRTISLGDEPQLPIEFSADGGNIAGRIEINNELHWLNPAVIEPSFFPAERSPTLTLRGQVPSIRLEDTEEATIRDWEIQNVENTFRIVDQLAIATRLSIDATGKCSVPAGFVGPLTGAVTGNVASESLIVTKSGAGGPVARFSSLSAGAELKVEFNSKDAATNNDFKITLNATAYGQFGLYDVTGTRFVWEYRRTTAGAGGGTFRLYDPLWLSNAYTAGAPTPTGYLVLYDSAGVAYKIPAQAV